MWKNKKRNQLSGELHVSPGRMKSFQDCSVQSVHQDANIQHYAAYKCTTANIVYYPCFIMCSSSLFIPCFFFSTHSFTISPSPLKSLRGILCFSWENQKTQRRVTNTVKSTCCCCDHLTVLSWRWAWTKVKGGYNEELTGLLDCSMSLRSHIFRRRSRSFSSCSLVLRSLSSFFSLSSVASISHLQQTETLSTLHSARFFLVAKQPKTFEPPPVCSYRLWLWAPACSL